MGRTTQPPNYDKYFAEKSYPFEVGKRYVYFSSLQNTKSTAGQMTYTEASKYLANGMSQISTRRTDNKQEMTKLDTALKYLKTASEIERKKETAIFNEFIKNFPERVPKSLDNIDDDYIKYITQINILIKGIKTFKKQVEAEFTRAKKVQEIEEKLSKRSEEVEAYELKQAQTENFYFKGNVEGQKGQKKKDTGINSIFSNKSNISVLTDIIIKEYGEKLFEVSHNKLRLNNGQLNALIKILINKANELFIINNIGKSQNYGINKNKEEYEKKAEETIKSKEFSDFLKSILNSIDLDDSLTSMAEQYGLNKAATNIEKNNKSIQILKDRLFQSFINNNQNGTVEDFDNWREKNGASDEELQDMYARTQNVSAQAYYTGENISLADMMALQVAATLGGNANPTNDYMAGKVIFSFNENTTASKKIKNNVTRTQKKLAKEQARVFKKMKKTSNIENYKENIKLLRELRENQEKTLKDLQEKIAQTDENLNFFLSHVNIHGTVKGYETVGTNIRGLEGFQGASFGANIFEQLSIIQETMGSFITNQDVNWLLFAMINAASQAIGAENKTALENYFSTMIGYLMFNDAQLLMEDVIHERAYETNGSNDIHLYTINGIYIPNSYILEKTYNALAKIPPDIQSDKEGLRARLHVYKGGPVNLTPDLTLKEWEATSDLAIQATKLDMHFLAGFLDILENIAKSVSELI